MNPGVDIGADAASNPEGPSAALAIRRGLRRLCPRCGGASIADPATRRLREVCPVCSLPISRHSAAALPVAYLSTAAVNGAVIVGGFLFGMPRTAAGVAAVLAVALGAMLLTWPARQGLGVALDWLTDRGGEAPGRAG